MKLPASLLALIALVVAFRFGFGIFGNYLVANSTGKSPACLELVGNTTSEDEGRTYIIGSIRNGCDRSFNSITILFKLDRAPSTGSFEMPQGVAYAYSRDLKPGETRDFKSALPISRNTGFQFDGINAY